MAKKASERRPPKTDRPKKLPEKRIGPFHAGVGVCVWLNTIQTDQGPRTVRSITINPRRYLDRETQQWKDSGSYNPSDLPSLIVALQKAQEFVLETPLPGQQHPAENEPHPDGDIPF